jgi:imidazoleglycerol-phosphate dehydratase
MQMFERKTKETDIKCGVLLNGVGDTNINTGIGFFDHMLEAFSKHSGIDIQLSCKGDLHIDNHHSVEDCGIVLGQALKNTVFPIGAIKRFGNSGVVMDEALVNCDLDLSNRAYLHFYLGIVGNIGSFESELIEEFFRALTLSFGITLHLQKVRGANKHHISEACFKAFGVALKRALESSGKVGIPSTKGVL